MQRLYRYFLGWIRNAIESIAFLPLPMMVIAIGIGIGLFHLELNTELSATISEKLPSVVVSSQQTARSILGILIGGVITLCVFTFTQMMSLFSQVANSYSPRLLPFFTGSRALQFVMGYYLSTIIISIIVLLSIRENEDGFVPNLSVLLCIILGVMCLVLFLYFVTTISNKIQVSNIIETVFQQGVVAMKNINPNGIFQEKQLPADVGTWPAITSPIGGFVGSVNYGHLAELAKKYETRFYVGAARGQFVPLHFPLLQTERALDKEQIEEVLDAVSPIHRKFNDWHLPPIRLLTEIAVKAMSPGINDPGTAIDVADRLTGLLTMLMNQPDYNYHCSEDEKGEVWLKTYTFGEVLAAVMQELRQYGKADPLFTRRLFQMLFHLLGAAGISPHQIDIRQEIEALLEDARANILNSADRRLIAREINAYRQQHRWILDGDNFLQNPEL